MSTENKTTTHDLFVKHFGDKPQVNLSHPAVESFFEELNNICIEEDNRRKITEQ